MLSNYLYVLNVRIFKKYICCDTMLLQIFSFHRLASSRQLDKLVDSVFIHLHKIKRTAAAVRRRIEFTII